MNPNIKGFAENMNEKLKEAKTEEEIKEAVGRPYLELREGDRIYKNAFMISKDWEDKEIEIWNGKSYDKKIIKAKWGFKILSKECKGGGIIFACYFGDVDNNDDWYNKRKGGAIGDAITKEKFEEFVNLTQTYALANDLDFNVQDYSAFMSHETQMQYGVATKQMEISKINLSKEAQAKVNKIKGKERTCKKEKK